MQGAKYPDINLALLNDETCYRCGQLSTLMATGLCWECERDDQLLDEASNREMECEV